MKIIRITSSDPQSKRLITVFRKVRSCRVPAHSANLSYTFLFTLFPLLIIVSFFIGRLDLSSPTADLFIQNILPSQMYLLIRSYLDSVEFVGAGEVLSALALSVYSCVRIALSLRDKITSFYGIKKRDNPLGEILIACVFSLLLLVGIILSLVALVTGEWLFDLLESQIAFNPFLVRLWLLMRFALVGAFIFVLFFVLYRYLPGIPLRAGDVIGGTVFSTVTWVVLSAAFSFYVNNLHDYSVIYGSIGVTMILLLWLYLTNFVLLTGACINACRYEGRMKK